MEEKKDKIQQLKEKYEKLQKMYNLPGFDELNREFEIEKIKAGSFILKEIRRAIIEKTASVLKLLELMMNPANAPFFMFSIIKNLKSGAKKEIEEMYKNFTTLELGTLKLDIEYDEKAEAEFIKEIAKKWQEYKKDIISICNEIESAWHSGSEKTEKDYLG
jgi:hypothetical protein